jgi:hypothetical protein
MATQSDEWVWKLSANPYDPATKPRSTAWSGTPSTYVYSQMAARYPLKVVGVIWIRW